MYVLTKDYKIIQPWELGGIDYIKYAPTIEELCDYFYVDVKNYPYEEDFDLLFNDLSRAESAIPRMIEYAKHWLDKDLPTWEDVIEEVNSFKFTIYGVIKTNKGLIYVAKTNKNGELELL